MDAISFVLGIQSKHLRSNQLKELIFKRSSQSGSARKAIVKLVYQFDSSDHELRAKFENSSELEFSRSISAAGVTNYHINRSDVTFEAYENALESIGVLVRNVRFSFMFQASNFFYFCS